MKQNTLTSFIAASSLPIVFLPLFGLAVGARRSGADLDFSMVAIFLPLFLEPLILSPMPLAFSGPERPCSYLGQSSG